MQQKSKIAVVILNWNSLKFLETFLPKLVDYSSNPDVKIWIADNNSSDKSIEYITNNFKHVGIVQLDRNWGFAEGYNKALEQIEAEYYVLVNSDVEVTKNWIEPIIEYMDKNPDVAAVQPKILSYSEKENFEYAGAAGGFIDKYGYPFCKGRIFDKYEKDNGQYDQITEIFWATGACMFVRANDYNSNRFDGDLFAHMEEIDLCWRLKNKGRKIIYFPDVKIYHVGGGTLPNNSPFKLYLNYRNNLLILYKNLPKGKIFGTIFIRMLLDGISASVYLLKFQFKLFAAVAKAHFHFYKMLPKYKAKRAELVAFNHLNHKEIYKKSIVYSYFLQKKTIFTQLNFHK